MSGSVRPSSNAYLIDVILLSIVLTLVKASPFDSQQRDLRGLQRPN